MWDWCLKMMVNVHGFQGKSTGNHRFSDDIVAFPVILPLNQSVDNCHCDPFFLHLELPVWGGVHHVPAMIWGWATSLDIYGYIQRGATYLAKLASIKLT